MKKYEKPMIEEIVVGVTDCVLQGEVSSIGIETHDGTSNSGTGQLSKRKRDIIDDDEDGDYGW